MTSPTTFRTIFGWMMVFAAMTWLWTIALIFSWPWDKDVRWEPDMRLVAVCAGNEACSVSYGELAAAKAKGVYSSLEPAEAKGEVMEADAWLRWERETGKPWQYEVTRSSWDFESKIRYRFDGETPVLVAKRDVGSKPFLFALPLALFTVIGLFFRRFRKR